MSKNKKIGGLERFQTWLAEHQLDYSPVMLDDAANTAEQAANALRCSLSQIAKSLVFRVGESDSPVLVIASGTNRVNEERIASELGKPITRADAACVREQTSYAIGGVPPFGHANELVTIVDHDLLEFEAIWAAAGHPKAVFKLKPQELARLTGGTVMSVT